MGFFGGQAQAAAQDWWEDGNPFIENRGSNVLVTASSTIHTKGAWTEIIASTSADCSLITVAVQEIGVNNVKTAVLLDIATGASGSEVVIIENVAVGSAHGSNEITADCIAFELPFKVASGTRISARIQALIVSETARVTVSVCSAGDFATAPTSVDVIGTSTTTSEATALTGLTTYAELIASTTRAYRALVVIPSASQATMTFANEIMTVAVGASGSEVDFAKVPYRRGSTESVTNNFPFRSLFARSIPSGSRLSVKGSASGTGVQCTVIGIP